MKMHVVNRDLRVLVGTDELLLEGTPIRVLPPDERVLPEDTVRIQFAHPKHKWVTVVLVEAEYVSTLH